MTKRLNLVTVIFNKDVCEEDLAQLPSNFSGDIIINGKLTIEGDILINCDNIYAKEIFSEAYPVKVVGNVHAKCIDTYDIIVNGSIYCSGLLDACNTIVAQDLILNVANFNNYPVFVGGDLSFKFMEHIGNIEVIQW